MPGDPKNWPREPTDVYTWRDVDGASRVIVTFNPEMARNGGAGFVLSADSEVVDTYRQGSVAVAFARRTVKERFGKELAEHYRRLEGGLP